MYENQAKDRTGLQRQPDPALLFCRATQDERAHSQYHWKSRQADDRIRKAEDVALTRLHDAAATDNRIDAARRMIGRVLQQLQLFVRDDKGADESDGAQHNHQDRQYPIQC